MRVILSESMMCFFLFSATKVTPHSVFVKGHFTLRVKNLPESLRSCGIFYPSPLTNLHASLAVVWEKRKNNVV